MIILIILLILCIIGALFVIGKEYTMFEATFSGIMVAIMLYFIIALPMSIRLETEVIETKKVSIYSIKNETSIYGHFCIGTGTIESKIYYYYYTKNESGYILSKIDAEQVYIEECEDLENIGYVCTYGKQLSQEDWLFNFGRFSLFGYDEKTTIIKVPKGTMQIEFKID